MKRCKVCNIEKDEAEFPKCKNRYGKIYVENRCYKCRNYKDKDKRNEYAKKVYYADTKLAKQKRDLHYLKNPGCRSSYNKKYYDANSENIKKRHREYSHNNLEKVRGWCRKRRGKLQNLMEAFTKNDEFNTKQLFSHMCFKCKAINRLEIDHHYPLSSGFSLTPKNAVLLCKSCNSSKHNKVPQKFYSAFELYQVEYILAMGNLSYDY